MQEHLVACVVLLHQLEGLKKRNGDGTWTGDNRFSSIVSTHSVRFHSSSSTGRASSDQIGEHSSSLRVLRKQVHIGFQQFIRSFNSCSHFDHNQVFPIDLLEKKGSSEKQSNPFDRLSSHTNRTLLPRGEFQTL